MQREIDGELLEVPEHVAIILDGNGRWAKKRMMPRNYGHAQGSKTVEQICEDAWNLGIKYLTVYAFSTENWKRPEKEVNALMKLLRSYLKDCIKLEQVSSVNTGLNFTIAINYGSRDEMRRAMVRMAGDVELGKVASADITEELFNSYLDTWDIPDPDLLIRTSGEQRLSNFLLWQLAYTEFLFMDVLWPDFNRNELVRAIRQYNGRERRFGGI